MEVDLQRERGIELSWTNEQANSSFLDPKRSEVKNKQLPTQEREKDAEKHHVREDLP